MLVRHLYLNKITHCRVRRVTGLLYRDTITIYTVYYFKKVFLDRGKKMVRLIPIIF